LLSSRFLGGLLLLLRRFFGRLSFFSRLLFGSVVQELVDLDSNALENGSSFLRNVDIVVVYEASEVSFAKFLFESGVVHASLIEASEELTNGFESSFERVILLEAGSHCVEN